MAVVHQGYNLACKIPAWDMGRFETTDKVTIGIIQKIITLISSLFPAINHVIIRILAFFRTFVFLESDFNDFFSGFGRFLVPRRAAEGGSPYGF